MRSAIVSTFPPRVCGIGTFAADLSAALLEVTGVDGVEKVAVVEDASSSPSPGLLAAITQEKAGDYVRAARLLGRLDLDVVLLEQEYGIFGGADGEHVLSFARELAQPLVVTLHTVLSEPSPHQLRVLRALCREAERVIVMIGTARRLLVEVGACDVEKIRVVPHGAPTILGLRREQIAEGRRSPHAAPDAGGFGQAQSRFTLSTFGLLSAGKGLETAIKALPLIVERHPKALYVIAGRTHPDVTRREGERYRLMLERLVVELDLADHVVFRDRFLAIDELAELLASTDVFVTPYRNREQIASGALTFAIAAGCATVSTPYWYAEDMLGSGAGRIVPFDDPQALSDAVCELVEHPVALATAQAEARRIGSTLAWPSAAETTAAVLSEAITTAARRGTSVSEFLAMPGPRSRSGPVAAVPSRAGFAKGL